jgi:putative transposase
VYTEPDRRKLRMDGYDYDLPGYYFVTICTNKSREYFGEINDNKVVLSSEGVIAERCWVDIPIHIKNVKLDKHVIMPNHVHGIIEIVDLVGNWHANSLQRTDNKMSRFQKLPVVIGSYKSAVTKYINRSNKKSCFQWQRYYYDHIITSDESLDSIRDYIIQNPSNWKVDLENLRNKNKISKKRYEELKREHYRNLFK